MVFLDIAVFLKTITCLIPQYYSVFLTKESDGCGRRPGRQVRQTVPQPRSSSRQLEGVAAWEAAAVTPSVWVAAVVQEGSADGCAARRGVAVGGDGRWPHRRLAAMRSV